MFDNDEVIKHGIDMCEQEAKYIGTESLSQAQWESDEWLNRVKTIQVFFLILLFTFEQRGW